MVRRFGHVRFRKEHRYIFRGVTQTNDRHRCCQSHTPLLFRREHFLKPVQMTLSSLSPVPNADVMKLTDLTSTKDVSTRNATDSNCETFQDRIFNNYWKRH